MNLPSHTAYTLIIFARTRKGGRDIIQNKLEILGLYYKLAYICKQKVRRNASNINFSLFKAIDSL